MVVSMNVLYLQSSLFIQRVNAAYLILVSFRASVTCWPLRTIPLLSAVSYLAKKIVLSDAYIAK